MLDALFAQPAPGEGGGLMNNPLFPMFVLGLFLLFMMVVVWPAGRRARKEEEKMRSGLRPGTKVLTTGGVVGTVVTAKDGDEEIVVRSEDARLRIVRSAVLKVVGEEAKAGK
ncbi:MAG: preprotein translocase subunit YajC [Gemmataceae bacterium]|nr:preprotein translocase subunit YajC [Gemmataceae bacterium]